MTTTTTTSIDNDEREIAEAWNLHRVSIVNASSVAATITDDGHNYRQFAADALRAFTKKWLHAPHPNPIYDAHLCTSVCRMYEYVPPGRSSGDIFICRASADMHVCTKDLCRHTQPQHGFPGFNFARRAVCNVCALTRRVFTANPDQTIGGGGGGGGDGDADDDMGVGAASGACFAAGGAAAEGFATVTGVDIDPDAVAAAGFAVDEYTTTTTAAAAAATGSELRVGSTAPKRRRATAASSTTATNCSGGGGGVREAHWPGHKDLVFGDEPKHSEQRYRVYADVALKLMPEVASSRLQAWVYAMEHIWLVLKKSPGFVTNSSQLHPQFFALVCLNYMRNIGLTIPVATPTRATPELIRVLPSVPYIRDTMPDIKKINKRQFTPAERALLCCLSEMPVSEKRKLSMSDKTLQSL